MSRFSLTALAAALIFSPAAFSVPTGISRIFCQSESKNAPQFWTLRSDSSNRYRAPGISFVDQGGADIRNISNPLPQYSNNFTAEIYFVGTSASGANTFYHAQIDIPARQGQATAIFTLSPEPRTAMEAFRAWDMPRTQVALSQNFIAASRQIGQFEVLDRNTLEPIQSWKLDSNQILNPEFSEDGQWVKVEFFDNRNVYSTRIFSVATGEAISLPPSSQTQLGLSFVGDHAVTWSEADTFSPQSDKTITFKVAELSELRQGKSRTLKAEVSKNLYVQKVYRDVEGRLFTLSLEEEYLTKNNSPEKTLTKGTVLLTYLDETLAPRTTEKLPYDPTFYYLGKSMAHAPYGVISNMTYSPYSNHIIFSMGHLGGLASLNLASKKWDFHAVNMQNTCYNPVVGLEEKP